MLFRSDLLANDGKRWEAISNEIKIVKDKFGKKTAIGKRRTDFAEVSADIDVPLEAYIEKEPLTIILSQKGWIRGLKGHNDLNDEFKFKDDDALLLAIHAQTTDKIILFDTSGKFFTIPANDIPCGRGFGQPLRLMVDLGINDNISSFSFKSPASR